MTDLPAGWLTTTMGEVCEVVGGSTPRTSIPANWGGSIPWITPDDLSRHHEKVIFEGGRSITQVGYDSCSTALVPAGTVLYTTRAPIGYVAVAGQPVCTNQGFKSFVPSPEVSSDYLYWYLRHLTPVIREMGSGTTFREVSKKVAKTIPVVLPPLAEQQRIVAAIEEQFSRLDAAEKSIRCCKRSLARFRAGALADTFAGDYPMKPLGDVARTQLGKMLSRKANKGAGQPYLRNKNVQWGRFDLIDVPTMEFSDAEAAKFRLAPGDVLVCEGGEVGRAAVWRGQLEDCYYQKALHRVRPTTDLLPEFLVHYLRRLADTHGFDRFVTGSTIDHLPQEDLRIIPLPVPSVSRQAEIVSQIDRLMSVADAMESQLDASLVRSAALRRVVLREAFSGRLAAPGSGAIHEGASA